jgi:hypothetical protein
LGIAIQIIEPNSTSIWSAKGPNTVIWSEEFASFPIIMADSTSSDYPTVQIYFQSDSESMTLIAQGIKNLFPHQLNVLVPTDDGEYVIKTTLPASHHAVITLWVGGAYIPSEPFIIESNTAPSQTVSASESGAGAGSGSTSAAGGQSSGSIMQVHMHLGLFIATLFVFVMFM